jgi:hypothetical protein
MTVLARTSSKLCSALNPIFPPLIEEEAQFQNIYVVLERTYIWFSLPAGTETKNDCAGEDQQKIIALL